jgi:hypothetical protein
MNINQEARRLINALPQIGEQGDANHLWVWAQDAALVLRYVTETYDSSTRPDLKGTRYEAGAPAPYKGVSHE